VPSPSQQHLFDATTEESPWERAAAELLVADVVLNRPLDESYSYIVPEELADVIGPGQRVKVPFGRGDKRLAGYCVKVERRPAGTRKLKSIEAVLDREPLLSADMLELTRWIAARYLCAWGQVLESVVPAGVKKQAGTRLIRFLEAADDALERMETLKLPAKQQAVMDVLLGAGRPLRVDEVTSAAKCGTSPVDALRKRGLIASIRQRSGTGFIEPADVPPEDDLVLNHDQRHALAEIVAKLRTREHATLLLHGVTGSGKTEVYIQAIREVVSYGKQAIVLVPEISLTPQTIRRFRSRFEAVAVLHSHLGDAERHRQWQQISDGRVQVVVGARSAVFAPTPHLGLIIIDEEHETSFKQDTVPRYHAREVARERARREGVPLVLGSATPTLESLHRVFRKQDTLIDMPKRVAGLPLPPVTIVDTRNDPRIGKGEAIGRALRVAVEKALADGGQVILFLNLRGFSPVVWCRACSRGVQCPACDLTLTWHKDRRLVVCHSCGYESEPPESCPSCGHPGLRFLGTGTQRLEEEVRGKFPGASCLRMDSDSMRKPGSHDEALEKFRRGEVRVLLGTQMIAKGLDFPNVTLVGVVDADTILHQPDLRASERTFQLIAQVAGRTGRGTKGGRVLVQTACPQEPSIQFAAAHDYLGFARGELAHRREMQVPPFSHLARVILRGLREDVVKSQAEQIATRLREAVESADDPVRILGPAPAPVARLREHYRYHFQISALSVESIQSLWNSLAPQLKRSQGVDFVIDVDPINMR
jgi:primosomal protein N' (replication factor Y)